MGRGECAPLPPYDSVSLELCHDVLRRYAEWFAAAGDVTGGTILEGLRRIAELPFAIAAVVVRVQSQMGTSAT